MPTTTDEFKVNLEVFKHPGMAEAFSRYVRSHGKQAREARAAYFAEVQRLRREVADRLIAAKPFNADIVELTEREDYSNHHIRVARKVSGARGEFAEVFLQVSYGKTDWQSVPSDFAITIKRTTKGRVTTYPMSKDGGFNFRKLVSTVFERLNSEVIDMQNTAAKEASDAAVAAKMTEELKPLHDLAEKFERLTSRNYPMITLGRGLVSGSIDLRRNADGTYKVDARNLLFPDYKAVLDFVNGQRDE